VFRKEISDFTGWLTILKGNAQGEITAQIEIFTSKYQNFLKTKK
jgi:hypothetical protein